MLCLGPPRNVTPHLRWHCLGCVQCLHIAGAGNAAADHVAGPCTSGRQRGLYAAVAIAVVAYPTCCCCIRSLLLLVSLLVSQLLLTCTLQVCKCQQVLVTVGCKELVAQRVCTHTAKGGTRISNVVDSNTTQHLCARRARRARLYLHTATHMQTAQPSTSSCQHVCVQGTAVLTAGGVSLGPWTFSSSLPATPGPCLTSMLLGEPVAYKAEQHQQPQHHQGVTAPPHQLLTVAKQHAAAGMHRSW